MIMLQGLFDNAAGYVQWFLSGCWERLRFEMGGAQRSLQETILI